MNSYICTNRKVGSPLSPVFLPVACAARVQAFHVAHCLPICFLADEVASLFCFLNCVISFVCFILGGWWSGETTWIVCQGIHGFLLTMSCRFEKKKTERIPPFPSYFSVSLSCGSWDLLEDSRSGKEWFLPHSNPAEMQETLQDN